MKILNLYAGIGGNRKLWGDEHEITAVELNEEVATVYAKLYPNDKVIVDDAHEYLLKYFNEYGIVWGSPPCPSHSRLNYMETRELEYPDMKLYQEIIVLKHRHKGLWVIENVVPYYVPLIPGKIIDRHMFWSNFKIKPFTPENELHMNFKDVTTGAFCKLYGYEMSDIKVKDKRKAIRNCVHPETGLHILNCALNKIERDKIRQGELFQ